MRYPDKRHSKFEGNKYKLKVTQVGRPFTNLLPNTLTMETDATDDTVQSLHHWRIRGVPPVHAPPPTGSNSFIFTCILLKSTNVRGQCSPIQRLGAGNAINLSEHLILVTLRPTLIMAPQLLSQKGINENEAFVAVCSHRNM